MKSQKYKKVLGYDNIVLNPLNRRWRSNIEEFRDVIEDEPEVARRLLGYTNISGLMAVLLKLYFLFERYDEGYMDVKDEILTIVDCLDKCYFAENILMTKEQTS